MYKYIYALLYLMELISHNSIKLNMLGFFFNVYEMKASGILHAAFLANHFIFTAFNSYILKFL